MSDWLTLPRMLLSPSNTQALTGRLLVYIDRSELQWWNQLRMLGFPLCFCFPLTITLFNSCPSPHPLLPDTEPYYFWNSTLHGACPAVLTLATLPQSLALAPFTHLCGLTVLYETCSPIYFLYPTGLYLSQRNYCELRHVDNSFCRTFKTEYLLLHMVSPSTNQILMSLPIFKINKMGTTIQAPQVQGHRCIQGVQQFLTES